MKTNTSILLPLGSWGKGSLQNRDGELGWVLIISTRNNWLKRGLPGTGQVLTRRPHSHRLFFTPRKPVMKTLAVFFSRARRPREKKRRRYNNKTSIRPLPPDPLMKIQNDSNMQRIKKCQPENSPGAVMRELVASVSV